MDRFKKKVKILKDKLLNYIPKSLEYQIIITETEISTFRYAKNRITQNTNEENLNLTLVLRDGEKEGIFNTNSLDDKNLEEAVQKASAILEFSPPDPELPPLPSPYTPTFSERDFPLNSSDKIIETLSQINQMAQKEKLEAFGACHNEKTKMYYFNSKGLEISDCGDLNTITLITYNKDGLSGYAGEGYHSIDELDVESFFKRAAQKVKIKPIDYLPKNGDYEVILEAPAVATILNTLSFSGLSAGVYQEGRSFMSGKLGQKMFPEIVTITDNVYHPKIRGLRIDYEGTQKKKVFFVENGILKELAHNLRTAQKEGISSTGHAVAPPEKYPYPMDVMMAPGKYTLDEMTKKVKKGLYITRFHYIGLVDEAKTTITGMTRDGTFLIENGEIVGSIGDLRFTDDITRILQNTSMIENKLYKEPGFLYGANIAPSLLTKTFKITGHKPKEKK